jgi:hypothetical protein
MGIFSHSFSLQLSLNTGKNCFVFNFRSDKESLREVLNDFVFPYLTDSSIVAELGCGGGAIRCSFLFLFISHFCLFKFVF